MNSSSKNKKNKRIPQRKSTNNYIVFMKRNQELLGQLLATQYDPES